MKNPFPVLTVLCAVAGCAPLAPVVDHHQHVMSPGIHQANAALPHITGDEVVGLLDQAGIRRGVLMSFAYSRLVNADIAKVRAENDYTAAQAARHPGRLRAFCGVNPLKDYALAEIARCAADPVLRTGLKMHFGNSEIQLAQPEHAARLREVFALANRHGMAIAVHLRASFSKKHPHGEAEARVFLEQLLAAAPDVTVQVAHMAGAGPGYADPPAHEVMAYLAAAVARGDPRTRRLYFDVASVANGGLTPQLNALLVALIRQVGPDRVLYGTDAAIGNNLRPRESWAALRRLALSDSEFRTIAANVAPYLR
jgi:predicted TIM-barrel fold metal-dependent hydrolase